MTNLCDHVACTEHAEWDELEGCYLCPRHRLEAEEAEAAYFAAADHGYDRHCEDQAALTSEPEPLGEWEWLHGLYEEGER